MLPSGSLALSCFLSQQLFGLAAHQRKLARARQHDPKTKKQMGIFLTSLSSALSCT